MANMLRKSSVGWFGCCNRCARKAPAHLKPGPRERHQARAREKRTWRRVVRDDT